VSQFPRSKEEMLRLVEGTPFEEVAKDEDRLREIVYDAMRTSDDPMTREIGEGLASGAVTPMELASIGAYRDFLDQKIQSMEAFDGEALVEQLEAAKAEAERAKAEEAARRQVDDDDDLWGGLPETKW
jgi:hypothetical protein